MAAKRKAVREQSNERGYWQEQIEKASKRYSKFHTDGDLIVDRYRLETNNATRDNYRDRYNILYSSVETMKPSLYATTPKVEAIKRQRDRQNETVTLATMLLETVTQYAMEDIDFDDVMNNAVEDFVLPGMGQAWVRYVPSFRPQYDNDNNPVMDGDEPAQEIDFEGLAVDYVHFKDFLMGPARTWADVPWVSRRVFMTRPKAVARFGKEKAARLQYSHNASDKEYNQTTETGAQAIIWEIWDKVSGYAIWYSPDYPEDLLDKVRDPLKLKDFFPCPRPMRAISNTRTMVPKGLYAEYKAQAEELDALTEKIRYLTQAINVRGVYDGSQEQLQNLLTGPGNKMVKIDNWAQFAGQGGINGAIQWVPIKDVAGVLAELLRQREIVKAEIYEITGFSDIVRGVSKASETLGAQQIKADWATGRLRTMQKEVQRFARDIIRIMAEIISEHFQEASLAEYAGFEPPPVTDEETRAAAAAVEQGVPPPPTMQAQAIQQFQAVVQLLKNEKTRCAMIGIETDSTILPDEAKEREDRMQFLSSVGAFLQQAGPMALQFPDMRGLLGAIMMFTIRTFRSSRAVEKEFEDFQKKLAEAPPMAPPGSKEEGGEDKGAQAAQMAQLKVQEAQLREQGETQRAQMQDATARFEVQQKEETARQKAQMDHEYRMRELQVRERELAIKEAELGLKRSSAAADADLERERLELDRQQGQEAGEREDERLEAEARRDASQAAAEAKNNGDGD